MSQSQDNATWESGNIFNFNSACCLRQQSGSRTPNDVTSNLLRHPCSVSEDGTALFSSYAASRELDTSFGFREITQEYDVESMSYDVSGSSRNVLQLASNDVTPPPESDDSTMLDLDSSHVQQASCQQMNTSGQSLCESSSFGLNNSHGSSANTSAPHATAQHNSSSDDSAQDVFAAHSVFDVSPIVTSSQTTANDVKPVMTSPLSLQALNSQSYGQLQQYAALRQASANTINTDASNDVNERRIQPTHNNAHFNHFASQHLPINQLDNSCALRNNSLQLRDFNHVVQYLHTQGHDVTTYGDMSGFNHQPTLGDRVGGILTTSRGHERIRVYMCNADMWLKFHHFTNEMIITKQGRCGRRVCVALI